MWKVLGLWVVSSGKCRITNNNAMLRRPSPDHFGRADPGPRGVTWTRTSFLLVILHFRELTCTYLHTNMVGLHMICVHLELKNEGARSVCQACGLTRCPECARFYDPMLGVRAVDGVRRAVGLEVIQKEFPGSTAIQREALITGMCGEACWDKFCGGEA